MNDTSGDAPRLTISASLSVEQHDIAQCPCAGCEADRERILRAFDAQWEQERQRVQRRQRIRDWRKRED